MFSAHSQYHQALTQTLPETGWYSGEKSDNGFKQTSSHILTLSYLFFNIKKVAQLLWGQRREQNGQETGLTPKAQVLSKNSLPVPHPSSPVFLSQSKYFWNVIELWDMTHRSVGKEWTLMLDRLNFTSTAYYEIFRLICKMVTGNSHRSIDSSENCPRWCILHGVGQQKHLVNVSH